MSLNLSSRTFTQIGFCCHGDLPIAQVFLHHLARNWWLLRELLAVLLFFWLATGFDLLFGIQAALLFVALLSFYSVVSGFCPATIRVDGHTGVVKAVLFTTHVDKVDVKELTGFPFLASIELTFSGRLFSTQSYYLVVLDKRQAGRRA
ncbi:MAG: hypothetical protein AAFX06_31255 [Planctomycetota bacterium]